MWGRNGCTATFSCPQRGEEIRNGYITPAELNVQKRGWEPQSSSVVKEEGCYSLNQK